jgi:hypothetical protein
MGCVGSAGQRRKSGRFFFQLSHEFRAHEGVVNFNMHRVNLGDNAWNVFEYSLWYSGQIFSGREQHVITRRCMQVVAYFWG